MRDTVYAEDLVGPLTVNTLPRPTLHALLDHGRIRPGAIEENLDQARAQLEALVALGIDLETVCDQLRLAGIKSFADAFDKLFVTIKQALA
jgi:transaldolase/glucose-6-phosphate isomerase